MSFVPFECVFEGGMFCKRMQHSDPWCPWCPVLVKLGKVPTETNEAYLLRLGREAMEDKA